MLACCLLSIICAHICHDQAAGECTKYKPPNIAEFDGVQDGSLAPIRPRARNMAVKFTAAEPSAAEQALTMMSAFFAAQAKASAPCLPLQRT